MKVQKLRELLNYSDREAPVKLKVNGQEVNLESVEIFKDHVLLTSALSIDGLFKQDVSTQARDLFEELGLAKARKYAKEMLSYNPVFWRAVLDKLK